MKNIVIYTAELLLLAFVLSACSPIGSSDTASVSFTIDKNMAQHIADAAKKIPLPRTFA